MVFFSFIEHLQVEDFNALEDYRLCMKIFTERSLRRIEELQSISSSRRNYKKNNLNVDCVSFVQGDLRRFLSCMCVDNKPINTCR